MGSSKRVSKKRQTFARQIRSMAENDIDAAIAFANRGKKFSEIETMLWTYYWVFDGFKKNKSAADKSENQRAFKVWYEWQASQLFSVLINAVNLRDAKEIFEIAKGVEFLKTFREKPSCNHSKILELRDASEKFGVKFTIRQVAQLVGWPDMKSPDGFSVLRRLCAKLKLSVAPSRQTKKK